MAEPEPPQTSEQLALVLKELEQRTERLKQLYEQYFMGIERMEPMVARKEVTRSMLALQQNYIRNTAIRFKFNTMLQKWSLYTTYWNRTLREIEAGTYVRHLQKAARKAAKEGKVLPSEMRLRGIAIVEETPPPVIPPAPVLRPPSSAGAAPTVGPPPIPGRSSTPPPIPPGARGTVPPPIPGAAPRTPTPPAGVPVRPTTPAAGVPARVTTPPGGVTFNVTPPQGVPARVNTPAQGVRAPPPSVPGMSETDLRALHKKYVDARVATGDNAPVRYETLVASLAKQAPKVLEQPGVKGVKFDVAIRDGKPVLKATPTK